MVNYRQLFKTTGLLGSVQALYIAIAVLRNKVTAVLIGPLGMGMAELYLRALDLVANSTNMGLGSSAVKVLSETYEQASNGDADAQKTVNEQIKLIRTWVLMTGLLGMLVCITCAPLISLLATNNDTHTNYFRLMSPIVLWSTLMGGEIAILKATRQLKWLALASTLGGISTLAISAPIYYLWDMKGIGPVLFMTSLATFFFNLYGTCRRYPYRVGPFNGPFLRRGIPLLRLGAAFVVAGVMTTGAEMLIRAAIIRSTDGLSVVGYYAAGYTLTASYARMIFVAMDADYFPRLSAICNHVRPTNILVNRQINTLIVLMAPFLIAFCLGLPLIIRILYTNDFLNIIPMVICAAPFMYFKAIYTPIAYLALARGDSFRYMLMELTYDVVFCLSVIAGYIHLGLVGAGIGLTVANLFDLFFVHMVYRHYYGFCMNQSTMLRCIFLFVLLITGLLAAYIPDRLPRYGIGTLSLVMTIPVVWPILKKLKRKGNN